jgi:hypothetical protein
MCNLSVINTASPAVAERDELLEAARNLDERMQEMRDQGGKSLSLEAMAVMAALNLSHDLLRQQRQAIEPETASLAGRCRIYCKSLTPSCGKPATAYNSGNARQFSVRAFSAAFE